MSNDGTSANIRVDGVKATVNALKTFEPELHKALNKSIRKSLNVVKARAQGKYPEGQWAVQLTTKRLLGSIYARGGSVTGRWGESAGGVKASIFEFVGSRTMGDTPQAKGLIKSLTTRYGQPGRFLWAAWDEVGDTALEQIRVAVKTAESELQARLDARGEG
jgi:hypothetical protein